jgi:hypothetical protein
MQISMHAYWFNGKAFMVTVHECSCDDRFGHPEVQQRVNLDPSLERFKSLRVPGYNTPENRAVRALRSLSSIMSVNVVNGNLLVVTHTKWEALKDELEKALELSSKPGTGLIDALAQAAFGTIEVEERIELDELRSYRDPKYDDHLVAEPKKPDTERYLNTNDDKSLLPTMLRANDPTLVHRPYVEPRGTPKAHKPYGESPPMLRME